MVPRRRLGWLLVLFLIPSVVHAAGITVDFTSSTLSLNPIAVGMDETGYYNYDSSITANGTTIYVQVPNNLADDPTEQQWVKALALGYMRMDLTWQNGGLVCGGSGCDTRWTGDQWIQTIKSMGAEPVVVVHIGNPGGPIDTSTAAAIVRHFNVDSPSGLHVKYWIIGNEPNMNGYTVQQYSDWFNASYDAMKAVDSTIKIGGPALAWYDPTWLQQFLGISGSRVDFLDFHGYPQQGNVDGDTTFLFNQADAYGQNVSQLQSIVGTLLPARAAQMFVEVGEWELNWGGSAQDNTIFHTLWSASTLGGILQAGGVAMAYGTKGNLISSAISRPDNPTPDAPTPLYWGHVMFTGGGLFQRFGNTLVKSSTTLSNVEIFASNNPMNIVVINKSSTAAYSSVNFQLTGISAGTAQVWRIDQTMSPSAPPAHAGSVPISAGTFAYAIPAFSVTTFAISPSSPAPASLSPPKNLRLR